MDNDPVTPRSISRPNTLTQSNTQPTSEASGDAVAAPQLALRRGLSDSASATLERHLRHDDTKRRVLVPDPAAGERWSDVSGNAEAEAGPSTQAGSGLAVTESGIAPGQTMVGMTATQLGDARVMTTEDRERYHDQSRATGQMPTPEQMASHPGKSPLRVDRLVRNQPSSSRPTPIRIEDAADWRRVFGAASGTVNEEARPEDAVITHKRGQSTTAEESQGKKRAYGVDNTTSGTTALAFAGSSSNPIDLTSPSRSSPATSTPRQRSPLHPPQAQSPPRRESSNIVLPPWQPDNEVDRCNVCDTAFSLWYRRHHCRKCGRVVCSNCSPHRITIPRQFIVQHPADLAMQRLSTGSGIAARLAQEYERDRALALGGAETVRVCNPCVPDPNFSPPPRLAASPSLAPTTSSGFALPASARPHIPERGSSRTGTTAIPQPSIQPSSQGYAGYQFLNPSSSFAPPIPSSRPAAQPSSAFSSSSLRQQATLNAQFAGPQHRHSVQGPISSHRHSQHYGRTSSLSQHQAQAPPPPRRVIREEDECPICGLELPPKGPDGDETVREQHVVECIASYSAPTGTSIPTASTLTTAMSPQSDAVPQAVAGASGSLPSTSAPNSSSSSAPGPSAAVSIPARQSSTAAMAGSSSFSIPRPSASSSSPRAVSRFPHHHAPRMLVYHATEKDCVDLASGEPQECVICFEEFEEGDEMGRLECLCKFHRGCIRGWWERKGVGSCPTHQIGVWE